MADDLQTRLKDAGGAPRFDVPVEELFARAQRTKRRHAAIGSGAVAVLVAVAATLFALLPVTDEAPVIAPTPPGVEDEDGEGDADGGDRERDTRPDEDEDRDEDDAATDADGGGADGGDDVVEEAGLLAGVELVVADLDGLRDQDGQLLTDTAGRPDASVVRDGDGGIVHLDADGLWWLPADATEPELVHGGELGRVVDVEVVEGEPVARTNDADIALTDGEQVDGLASLELPDPGESPPLAAANGLVARLDGPQVDRTPEGTIEEVLEPASLHIERDGEVELSLPVGTEHEPLVRLHDFDGRRVVVSRGPEEPAMAPETVVALDLDCPDCVETLATSSPGGAALVGDDVDWDGPVQAPREDLVTPMVTDEGVEALPDGRHLLVDVAVPDDGAHLTGDLVIWFSPPVSRLAAREDAAEEEADHHVRNRDPARLQAEVAEDVEVTSGWYGYEEHGNPDEGESIAYAQFLAAVSGDHEGDVRDNLRTSPWWVTIEDGRIVRLEEQYVP